VVNWNWLVESTSDTGKIERLINRIGWSTSHDESVSRDDNIIIHHPTRRINLQGFMVSIRTLRYIGYTSSGG
jgi:hypothetical protein